MPRALACRTTVSLALLLALTPASAQDAKLEGPATLTVAFTNNGEPLADPLLGKFYVYEPGKRESYLGWGHAARSVRVPAGVYDIVIRYAHDKVVEERVLEEFELSGEVVLEEQGAFELPEASLTVDIISGGSPIPVYSGSFHVYRAGQRGTPLAAKRPGETVTIAPGTYDIEVVYRDPLGLKSAWLNGYRLEGDRYEAVELGVALARLRVTLLEDGRPLSEERGRWRVIDATRRDTVAEGRSGEARDMPAGTYDIGLFFEVGPASGERWLRGVEITGDEHRQIEVGANVTTLKVDVSRRGTRMRGAWYTVYPEGRRVAPLIVARSGAEVEIDPGIYDIHCTFRDEGIRADRWLAGRRVSGRTVLDVELEVDAATLRVLPPRRVRGSVSDANVLVLLDSSSEMRARMGTRTRLQVAQDALRDSAPALRESAARLGLRVYGIHPRNPPDCEDSTLLLPLAPVDTTRLGTTLDLLRPSGMSPLAFNLEQAERDLPPDARNTVVLLTGSVENCGGDPCASASRLLARGRVERLHVLALDTGRETEPVLGCVGFFERVTTPSQLRTALREILRDAAGSDLGSIHVFDPDSGDWVTGGALGETLRLSEGDYDVRLRAGSRMWTWRRFPVSGDTEAVAGARP